MLPKKRRQYLDSITKISNHAMIEYLKSLGKKYPDDETEEEILKTSLLKRLKNTVACSRSYNNTFRYWRKHEIFIVGNGTVITYINKKTRKDRKSDGLNHLTHKLMGD